MIRVVDVSEHQGTIDFDKFKNAMNNGYIQGMIIRTGFGMYQEDSQAKRNIQMCEKYGIPYGLYHYSYARNLTEAEKEVRGMLTSIVKWGAKPSYPVVIDMEDADGWKNKNWLGGNYWKIQSDIVKYFCDQLEKAGFYAMWYSSASWVTNLQKYNDLLGRYDLWLAHWGVSKPSYPCGIWQYSAEGNIASGITGYTIGMGTLRLDLNYVYKDYPAIITGTKNVPKVENKQENSPKKTNEQVAQEVIDGKWGNGNIRKEKLKQAGYDYLMIQSLVNQKLSKKSDLEIAKEVIDGKWGNGSLRFQKLQQAGYNSTKIQGLVNELMKK